MYDESDWTIIKTITLPVDGLVSIKVTDFRMCVCSATCGAVYITDLDGHAVKKCGSKGSLGSLGHFEEPRISQGSEDGACLISDPEKGCLQVMSPSGSWAVLRFDTKLLKPVGAVMLKRQLFLLMLFFIPGF